MNTYTAREILQAVNRTVANEATQEKSEAVAIILRKFLANLGDGDTI